MRSRTWHSRYPERALLGLALFVGQAFLYNAVTFDLGTILSTFFGVSSSTVPWFIILFAAGNFLGPLTLGRLFDTVGRRPMISGTYLLSAAIITGLGFALIGGGLTRWSFIAIVCVAFFFASAGASSAYLTVSEIFPMETRALAIAFFYAVGTGLGGIIGPLLFGHMIATNNRTWVMLAFLIGSVVMALGGIAEIFLGVKAEKTPLENIAKPLTAEEAEDGQLAGTDEAEDADEGTSREQRWQERYRPGVGSDFYSPGMLGTAVRTRTAPPSLQAQEVEAIAAALEEAGPLTREELGRRVGARRWGPGRFRAALGAALGSGRICREGRGFAPNRGK